MRKYMQKDITKKIEVAMNTNKEVAECYQQLSAHLANEHGLILIESELDEIIRLAQITVANYDSLVADNCPGIYASKEAFV